MSDVRVCGAGLCDRTVGRREADFCCGLCAAAWTSRRNATGHHSVFCDVRYDLGPLTTVCHADVLVEVANGDTARSLSSAEELLAEQVAAGAHLTYALFYADSEFIKSAPDSVVRAYGRACRAYGVRRT